MAAATEAVAEFGYAGATIAEITKRAGVSPKSFYEHFGDKLDCYLAGYDVLVSTLIEQIGSGLAADTDWPKFVEATLASYLGTLAPTPPPPAPTSSKSRRLDRRLGAAGARPTPASPRSSKCGMSRCSPRSAAGPLPDRVYLALVHGVRDLVADALDASESPRLNEIAGRPALVSRRARSAI